MWCFHNFHCSGFWTWHHRTPGCRRALPLEGSSSSSRRFLRDLFSALCRCMGLTTAGSSSGLQIQRETASYCCMTLTPELQNFKRIKGHSAQTRLSFEPQQKTVIINRHNNGLSSHFAAVHLLGYRDLEDSCSVDWMCLCQKQTHRKEYII